MKSTSFHKTISVAFLLLTTVLLITVNPLQSCQGKITEKTDIKTTQEASFLYKNHSDSAQYVGMQECKKCHQSIYESYVKTQMGRSLKKATLKNSQADFNTHQPIYDDYKNLYYLPFSKNGKMYIKEFRIENNDTTYQRSEKIDYIIGSGQHTNSHLMQINGYVHQMPLTYYTQDGHWDLPPGFENGGNTSFDRTIEVECMTCHNGFPNYVKGSKNKYEFIPEGIDCERCHGPGSIHVKEKMSGKIINVQQEIDYSIVNPAKLSPELQMDVCQRCHLQGVSVLKERKTFFDFKPGMKLNDFFDVYQSRFIDSATSFLMASQADRLRMSKCYIESHKTKNGVTCITCHNPHKSVTEIEDSYFNSKCVVCHEEKRCKEKIDVRRKTNDNCVECHMSSAPSYDIPHVSITDHRISKFPIDRSNIKKEEFTKSELEKQNEFVKLVCRTTVNPDNISNAKAYLNYYEKYVPNPEYLKTAEEYLQNYPNQNELFDLYVRLNFLKNNYTAVEKLSIQKTPYEINDAWTNYRIGQSLYNLKKFNEALPYFEQAVVQAPFDVNFSQKLAANYTALKMGKKAHDILEDLSINFPKNASVQNDFGYSIALISNGDINILKRSEKYFLKAIYLNPDLISAMENLASLYMNTNRIEEAKLYLEKLIKRRPENQQYKQLLNKI